MSRGSESENGNALTQAAKAKPRKRITSTRQKNQVKKPEKKAISFVRNGEVKWNSA